jgi:3-dehydrosphinganine reductase
MLTTIGLVGAGVFAFFLWLVVDKSSSEFDSIVGKHVIITGGSSGIGLATAKLLAREGAHVTILARDRTKLENAKKEIEAEGKGKNGKVLQYSVDVSDYNAVESAIKAAAEEHKGKIDSLICSAGVARPGRFLELPVDQFDSQMRTNYLGTVYATRATVPFMVKRKQGRIILISSMAGLVGIFGYTAYTPTKFALRGFAESLHMELRPYNIRVSLSFPPDVDTPQYVEENKFKPPETKAISEGAGLFTAEQLAQDLVRGLRSWSFFINTGFDGFMLGSMNAAMTPSSSILQGLSQVLLAPILRLVGLGYSWHYTRICRSFFNKNNKKD